MVKKITFLILLCATVVIIILHYSPDKNIFKIVRESNPQWIEYWKKNDIELHADMIQLDKEYQYKDFSLELSRLEYESYLEKYYQYMYLSPDSTLGINLYECLYFYEDSLGNKIAEFEVDSRVTIASLKNKTLFSVFSLGPEAYLHSSSWLNNKEFIFLFCVNDVQPNRYKPHFGFCNISNNTIKLYSFRGVEGIGADYFLREVFKDVEILDYPTRE